MIIYGPYPSTTAKTDYPISELIARRWGARAFSTKPVEKLKLLSILEAEIVFTGDNPEKLKRAQSVLKEINDYAKRASILICAITRTRYSDNRVPNRLFFHDLGAANENMFLEAY